MAPKVTSSSNRSKRRANRRPTSSKTRASRSKSSTNSSRVSQSGSGTKGRATVTKSGGGRQYSAGSRVTGSRLPELPAAGKSGGSKPPKGTKQPGTTRNQPQSRRSAAATRRAGASMGSRGSGVRTAGGTAPTYGQAARKQGMNIARRALGIGSRVLRGAGRLIAGRSDGSELPLLAAMETSNVIDAARGSTAKQRNKPQKQGPQPKQKPKPKKRNYQTAAEFANSKNPRYKPGNVTRSGSGSSNKSKPKPKPKPQVRQNVTEKPVKKSKPKKDNLTATQRRAYSADSRNKQYDELREAGKIKEASALAKKIAADAAAKRKKRR